MAADPFETYPGFETQDSKGKGKGKGHPVTPEPATYGLWFVGFCLLIWWAIRVRRAISSRASHAPHHLP